MLKKFQQSVKNSIQKFIKWNKVVLFFKEISKKGVKITVKADKSPVTNGDLAVDEILRSKIKFTIIIYYNCLNKKK